MTSLKITADAMLVELPILCVFKQLNGGRYFFQIDLAEAYIQIPDDDTL